MVGSNGAGVVIKEEADCSNTPTSSAVVTTTTNNSSSLNNSSQNRRGRDNNAVSLYNSYPNAKENQHYNTRRKHQPDDGRRHYHLNNNSPDATNRNLKYGQQLQQRIGEVDCRRTPPPPPPASYYGSHLTSSHTPNSRPNPVQVPQFPYYRQVLAPQANLTSFYPPHAPAGQPFRSRNYYHRHKYVSNTFSTIYLS